MNLQVASVIVVVCQKKRQRVRLTRYLTVVGKATFHDTLKRLFFSVRKNTPTVAASTLSPILDGCNSWRGMCWETCTGIALIGLGTA